MAQRKPPIVKGLIYKTGLFFRNLKRRYLVINTNSRNLIRYANELDVPDNPIEIIPLKDIKSVEPSSKRGLFFQNGFYYFDVVLHGLLIIGWRFVFGVTQKISSL